MTTTVSLDKIDLKILQALQHNGRLSNVELSERVALSPSPLPATAQAVGVHRHYPWLCRLGTPFHCGTRLTGVYPRISG